MKKRAKEKTEAGEEEEEACRNWLRRCSFWRENKFDLLSLNNNNTAWRHGGITGQK